MAVILGETASYTVLFGEVLPGKCSPSGQGPPRCTTGVEAEAVDGSGCRPLPALRPLTLPILPAAQPGLKLLAAPPVNGRYSWF